ncbi:hypothetical protein IFM89_010028 [Coptis chinensis]|uniref:Uncharacterized protein n=1 Tax=Coptis chinensis TaxID=261450 RepID=A0A835HLI7_9MAGN|nr:hypothetical protein IFM89_010028 [Coptis chinensis]
MKVPTGLKSKLWRFIWFLPFFIFISILGVIKATIFAPIAIIIVLVGNSAVTISLWLAHFIWTYYCVIKTKRIGLTLKILVLVCLPIPLVLWPILAIAGSLLVGIGYGIFIPLAETFEVSGERITDKILHYFLRVYGDKFTNPLVPLARLSLLPGCLLVSILAVPIDVVLITAVALCKSPYMLLKGWKRLLEDLIGREGPFLETVCVPFAGLAIILWPIAVVVAVVAAFTCSFILGLYAGIVVQQETSVRMGLAYIVSAVSLFDEYTNDLLYLREGSCLPRPKYRGGNTVPRHELLERESTGNDSNDQNNGRVDPYGSKLVREGSRTLKLGIKQLKPMQVWDWLFRSCEVNGRKLLHDGLIDIKDIEECILKGKCNKLGVKLPAWCILQCLLASAKSDSTGLLLSDEGEVGQLNWPKDKVLDWFIGPLLIMKEQIRGLHLDEREEACLRNLIMSYNNETPEDWNNTRFPSDDNVKRAQLQAIIRSLLNFCLCILIACNTFQQYHGAASVSFTIFTALSESEFMCKP